MRAPRDPAGICGTLPSGARHIRAGSRRRPPNTIPQLFPPPAENARPDHPVLTFAGQRSAQDSDTAVDDAGLRRARAPGSIAGPQEPRGLELLSRLHYIKQALAPQPDLMTAAGRLWCCPPTPM